MVQVKTLAPCVGLCAVLSVMSVNDASALEKKSPMMPGASTGAAAGALPPEGLYLDTTITFESGKLKNGSGDTAVTPAGKTIKATNQDIAATLLYVPGWKILGANYAMAVTQPYQMANTDFGGEGNDGATTSNKGFFNTILTPGILSWNLGNGFFVGTGVNVYVKGTGHYNSAYSSGLGRNAVTGDSYANNYWTVEPSFAISYLADGWNLTMNNTLDFNSKNKDTGYQTGSIYYLDLTATKKIGQWEVGAIGNFVQQFENDEVNGETVEAVDGFYSRGNKAQHIAVGPMVAYDFGKATLKARYLQGLHAENDANISFFHVGLSVPLQNLLK